MALKNTRITADIDTKNKADLITSLVNIVLRIEKINVIKLLKSPSKKGYHIIVLSEKDYNYKQILTLRKKIGDDINRIKIDKFRGENLQTLFKKKDRRGVKK